MFVPVPPRLSVGVSNSRAALEFSFFLWKMRFFKHADSWEAVGCREKQEPYPKNTTSEEQDLALNTGVLHGGD